MVRATAFDAMARIRVLDEALINLIAAGEVVERPASVVKELVENAVDAGATQIRVELSGGGLSRIAVIDDGVGMSREDVQLAVLRHATSKLADAEGLTRIETKGFRGEALAAVAAVSRFTVHTSEAQEPVGTRLVIEGGLRPTVSDAPPAGGTRIEVEDLFFNTPARRKFMRREATELVHCEEAVVRIALAHPEVAFFLSNDDRSLLASPASPLEPRERIAAALGPDVHAHLLSIEEHRLGLDVTGMIASPEFTLPTARGLYTFVNHRYIRDRGLNYAIQRAFQESLPPGRQPVAAIFIELDPGAVDVNVHPQKLEVRFQDAREVQDAVLTAVARALKAAPWRQQTEGATSPALEGAHYALAVERFLSRAQALPGAPLPSLQAEEGRGLSYGEARPGLNEAPPPGYFGALQFLGTLGQRFWVCEARGGTLVVLDPIAVRERVALLELSGLAADPGQGSLFAERVSLPAGSLEALLEHRGALTPLGIEVEPFGGDAVTVRVSHPVLEGVALAPLLVELAQVAPAAAALKEVAAAHAALRPQGVVGQAELRALLVRLDEADFSTPTRHPLVVVHEVPLLELLQRT